jgi:trehalose 6-phosphate synthase
LRIGYSEENKRKTPMSRLVVVSNRVGPLTDEGKAGGLAVGLADALRQRGGVWFGWSGETTEEGTFGPLHLTTEGDVQLATIDLTPTDVEDFYTGHANQALWPVLHYRVDLATFDRRFADAYERVNERVANRLRPLLRPTDTVWVHDYHFIPLAAELRRLGCRNRIGFFLHIPWAPPDVASALPAYRRLIEGLAAYDVVGFHTPQDADNFSRCLIRERIGRAVAPGVHEVSGRRLTIGAFPVGIDNEAFATMAVKAERSAVVRSMGASMGGRSLIIGVDRLDYSKGIKERIEAFSCFLRANPDFRNRVTFLQITPKSRSEVPEYQDMQHQIAEHVGRTNGNLGEVDWVPVRYINKTIAHSSLAGLYRLAEIGLVTPLRDGMNLVAKEFVMAQNPSRPGVLVLSRFAGAAHELDAALLVNPYDTEATATAIRQALEMSLDERRERWQAMVARLKENGVENWCRAFLEALAASGGAPGSAGEAAH